MDKNITFVYKDTQYTLQFTKRTVQKMEQDGFKLSEITDQAMTMIPMLVYGAFQANHKWVKRETIDEIFEKGIRDKDTFISALLQLYQQPFEKLIGISENGADDENFITWEKNFEVNE